MNKNTPPRAQRIRRMIEILCGLYCAPNRCLTHNQKRTIRQIAIEHKKKNSQDPAMLYNIQPGQFTDRNLESLYKIMTAHGYCFRYGEWSVAILLTPKLRKKYGCWEDRRQRPNIRPGRPRNKVLQKRLSDGRQNGGK